MGVQSVGSSVPQSITFTDRMRARFKGVLDGIGGFFVRLGLSPNAMTLLGAAGSIAGAVLLGLGAISLGGIVILVSGAADALDGTMARLGGEATRFGAFLDSSLDRVSELCLFSGLAIHFAFVHSLLGVALALAAAIGSIMVSYEKARAEALGFDCKVGLLTRMERYLVLCPALILNLPLIGLGLVALLGNFTAVQRFAHVYRQSRAGN
jgi:CDP-diacylglycerol--glycerol-3-phosphate 3-phosphatidyltransferase